MPRRRIYLQEPKSVELTALCVEEKNVQKLFCAPKENHFSNRSMIMLHGYICMLIYSFEILKNSKKNKSSTVNDHFRTSLSLDICCSLVGGNAIAGCIGRTQACIGGDAALRTVLTVCECWRRNS